MQNKLNAKLIIFSAPSGSGKTTLVKHLLSQAELGLSFSISATSRCVRGDEKQGKDYYFLSKEDFERNISENNFIEWEEVYDGTLYGTLRSELKRIEDEGKTAIFDMDVHGSLKLKAIYKENCLAIFVMPPSLEILGQRLRLRATDSNFKIQQRLAKAKREIEKVDYFDHVIPNNKLEDAKREAVRLVKCFLDK